MKVIYSGMEAKWRQVEAFMRTGLGIVLLPVDKKENKNDEKILIVEDDELVSDLEKIVGSIGVSGGCVHRRREGLSC